ncbi:MAG: class II aldolase/adducin family protein [Clostridiaceae bacterium]|jgi:L-fuculose-phosphate aldolase|nr:class II aldolase/adducin family protein [Clostridiaceae bacterium]
MSIDNYHPADQIVSVMQRIYSKGMTTISGGNISILNSNGDIWITPAGIDKSSLKRADIICVKADETIEGIHKPSSELPFHRMVYKVRPDFNAVIHAHPPALVSFSIVGKIPDTRLIPGADSICGKVALAGYALPGSKKLAEKVESAFKKNVRAVILENHGVLVAGKNLSEAFKALETLDYCAHLQIKAAYLEKAVTLSNTRVAFKEDDKERNKEEKQAPEKLSTAHINSEKTARQEMVRLIRRTYEMGFITSIQGDFSQRLKDNGFLITPRWVDRKNIQENDLVFILNGKKEPRRHPCASVKLHQYIYEKHPEINSVIIAQPLNIMAFAVTGTDFDSRIIPESYIMLRDIPRLPYGSYQDNAEIIARSVSTQKPVVMVENKCIIATGNSLINAFDRLEVLEYCAKSIIMSRNIGCFSPVPDKEIAEIIKAFNL